jgi:hypothetical protein|tara:strand:+ start:1074 stop:1373 length:300 start_codon:yes stop_codon:yes gene_type:complete
MLYLLLGVLAPIILNLIHLVVGIFITLKRGNLMSVGFTAVGFLTKTIGMIFLTWTGVVFFKLDFRIYVPILTFFWLLTHFIEAFVIKSYMNKNISSSSQ